jgi:hypothetical protein
MGSTDGRTPAGGYPTISREFAGFLAGFVEGEACFSIVRQSQANRAKFTCRSHRCVVAICARDDDQELIDELARATALGNVVRCPSHRRSRPQVNWRIHAKADCQRLIEILATSPLRGRKSHDYAIWRTAAEWWIAGDATTRPAHRDWTPMAYLRERLMEVKRYECASSPTIDDPPGLAPDWLPYLAGFVTAEGHLSLNRPDPKSDRVSPKLTVRLRADDKPLLEQLQARTGVGRIYEYARKGGLPIVQWVIFNRLDLHRIVELLDASPPRGRKLAEYQLWREGVRICNDSLGGKQPVEIRSIARRLKELRAYRPPKPARAPSPPA